MSSRKLSRCLSPIPSTYEHAFSVARDLANPPLQVKNASGEGAIARRCRLRASVGTDAQHLPNMSSICRRCGISASNNIRFRRYCLVFFSTLRTVLTFSHYKASIRTRGTLSQIIHKALQVLPQGFALAFAFTGKPTRQVEYAETFSTALLIGSHWSS